MEAARADSQAAREARNAVLVTSSFPDVARAYIDLRTAQEPRLNIANAKYRRRQTNPRPRAAAFRPRPDQRTRCRPRQAPDFHRAGRRRPAAGSRHQRPAPPRRTARRTDARSPALEAEGYSKLQPPPDSLPTRAVKVVTGLPVELLRRRPDIRQAERELAADNARIGVATADLFPRVAITGGYGLEGQGIGRIPPVSRQL